MSTPTLVPIRYQKIEARPMGVREFVSMIMRRNPIIIGIFLPVMLFSSYATFTATNLVTSSSRVFIESRRPEDPTFVRRISEDFDVIMSTAAQVAMSIPVAERAAHAIIDSVPEVAAGYASLEGINGEQALRDLLLENVNCSQVGESNILRIAYSHPSADFSLMATRALTDAYIAQNLEIRQNKTAVSYYNEQIRQVEADLDSVLTARADLMGNVGYAAFNENGPAVASQISMLERDYFDTRAERVALESRYFMVLEAIEKEPDFIPALRSGKNPDLLHLKRVLDAQRVELAELRQKHLEDSEWVRRQHSLIAETEQLMRRERAKSVEEMRITYLEMQNEENDLALAVEQQKQALALFPAVQKRISSLDIAISTQMDLMEILQTKRGEVRLKAASDKRVSNIIMLDKPSIDMIIGGGKRAVYLTLASIFGLALGVIAALFVDRGDHRLYNKQQVQEYLGVPVLGSITDTVAVRK